MNEIRFFDELTQEEIDIRTKVFVEEQGFEEEFDTADKTALHALLYIDGKAVACARLLPYSEPNSYIIGRIAVLKEYRKNRLGSEIVNAMIEKAKELGGEKAIISAQCRAQKFYETLGFEASGDIYYEEYCPHIHMEKKI